MPPKNASKDKCKTPTCGKSKGYDPRTQLCETCTYAQRDKEPAPSDSLSSYPLPAMAQLARIDATAMDAVVNQFNAGEPIDEDVFRRSMFGMMQNVFATVGSFETKLEVVKADVTENSERIKSLEDKVGNKDECAVPLSITLQNFKRYEVGDLNAVKSVIRKINAEGVNSEEAVVKVIRKGFKPQNGTQSERLGTVLVELQSSEVKAKIMRAKKVLANDEQLKNVRISNMKTASQVSQDFFNRQMLKLVPGGDKLYISGTGAILPKTGPPLHAHQGVRGLSQGPPSSQLPGQYQVRRPPGLHHQFQHHPGGHHVRPPMPNQVANLLLEPVADLSQPPPSASESVLHPIDF